MLFDFESWQKMVEKNNINFHVWCLFGSVCL